MGIADIIDWSIALLPVLLLTAVFIWLDVFKLMSLWETLGLLLMGAIAAAAAYPLSGVFLDSLPIGFNLYSRFVAPWIEESLKAIVIISLFRFNRIGFKLDAVISGFAVGAGFSVVENILYLMRFPDLPPAVWMVRGLGTAVMHGTTLAIMAAIAHAVAAREARGAASEYDFNPLWFVPGCLRRSRSTLYSTSSEPADAGHAGDGHPRTARVDGHFPVRGARPTVAAGRAQRPPGDARHAECGAVSRHSSRSPHCRARRPFRTVDREHIREYWEFWPASS